MKNLIRPHNVSKLIDQGIPYWQVEVFGQADNQTVRYTFICNITNPGTFSEPEIGTWLEFQQYFAEFQDNGSRDRVNELLKSEIGKYYNLDGFEAKIKYAVGRRVKINKQTQEKTPLEHINFSIEKEWKEKVTPRDKPQPRITFAIDIHVNDDNKKKAKYDKRFICNKTDPYEIVEHYSVFLASFSKDLENFMKRVEKQLSPANKSKIHEEKKEASKALSGKPPAADALEGGEADQKDKSALAKGLITNSVANSYIAALEYRKFESSIRKELKDFENNQEMKGWLPALLLKGNFLSKIHNTKNYIDLKKILTDLNNKLTELQSINGEDNTIQIVRTAVKKRLDEIEKQLISAPVKETAAAAAAAPSS